MFATGAARSFGVPVSQYIHDRHVGQFFHSPARATLVPSKVLAEAAAYIMCYPLIEAAYFIGIAKSQWVASTIDRFLSFFCDSSRQAFLLPDDKKLKFSSLREQILASRNVGRKIFQRFAGKVISFSLAVPECKLDTRETFKAISQIGRSSGPFVCIDSDLRAEILYWRFLDEWKDCFPWRSKHHLNVSLYSDASLRAWGAVLIQDGQRLVSRDVNVLESKALTY